MRCGVTRGIVFMLRRSCSHDGDECRDDRGIELGAGPVHELLASVHRDQKATTIRSSKGWSPATISRILDNEKYAGRWIWDRTESRRDPRTGRRRRFEKPESEWVIHEDEELRIIPKPLWDSVKERRKEMHRIWPGGNGKRGFSKDQGSRQAHFPTHLLAGSMVCGCCGATIAQVSGKSGGYYGCLAATRGACENKTLVRRTFAEKVILEAIQDQISTPSTSRTSFNVSRRRLPSNAPTSRTRSTSRRPS